MRRQHNLRSAVFGTALRGVVSGNGLGIAPAHRLDAFGVHVGIADLIAGNCRDLPNAHIHVVLDAPLIGAVLGFRCHRPLHHASVGLCSTSFASGF